MQGRARGGRGGGGYQYRSHGFQPYAAAAGGGWQAYGGGGGYNHHMQHGGGGGGGGGYGPVYAHRGALPLGVQGAGILKRPTGSPQGPLLHGRGHHHRGGRGGGGRGGRGGRGRGRGGRDKEKDQKPLTKEALDADLDEWRMKDKKNGGTSLDAELDDYWKDNKEDDPTDKDDGELLETAPGEEPAAAKPETPKSTKKSSGARPLDRGNGEAPEPSTNGAA